MKTWSTWGRGGERGKGEGVTMSETVGEPRACGQRNHMRECPCPLTFVLSCRADPESTPSDAGTSDTIRTSFRAGTGGTSSRPHTQRSAGAGGLMPCGEVSVFT